MSFNVNSWSLKLVFRTKTCTPEESGENHVAEVTVGDLPPPLEQVVRISLHILQELVRVLAPIEFGAAQAVVQLPASSVTAGVVLLLQRVLSLLLVSESFPVVLPAYRFTYIAALPLVAKKSMEWRLVLLRTQLV